MAEDHSIKIDENGHRYLEGKNGKRWPYPPGLLWGDEDPVTLSALFYGRQPLNGQEQAIYDLVIPIIDGLIEDAKEQFAEPTTFGGGSSREDGALLSLDAEGIAYQIAEILVENRFAQK